jgi:hypothetical protein
MAERKQGQNETDRANRAVTTGPEAQTTYDGRQIQPGTDIDPTLRSTTPTASAEAVADANPRDVTGDVPRTGRPIGTAEVQAPAVGRVAGVGGAAAVAAEGQRPQGQAQVVLVTQEDAERRARDQFSDREGVELLLDACRRYAINPDKDLPVFDPSKNTPADAATRPFRQLLSWQFYPKDASADGYDAVVLVTAGGVKIRHSANPAHPVDDDTESRLRNVFGAVKLNPVTREMEALPLPADLALPLPAILGIPVKASHILRGGYLASGGADGAAKRSAVGR